MKRVFISCSGSCDHCNLHLVQALAYGSIFHRQLKPPFLLVTKVPVP